MHDIARYARRLRFGILGAFGLVVVLVICGHFGVRIAGAPVLLQSRAADSVGAVGIGDDILLLVGIAVYWLSEALREVAAGGLFSENVVRRFRLFAQWMLIMALFSALAPTLLPPSNVTPPGRHLIRLVVDVRDFLLIALTLLLLLIARMFERARQIEDEMREIV